MEIESTGKIKVDVRNVKMQAEKAVRNVIDGLVELITNSDDAYRKMGKDKGEIIIEVTRQKLTPHEISVKDRAGGLTHEECQRKFLSYGSFEAHESSRGFMGRGAKDVAVLGDVTFESMKNGICSCIKINYDLDTWTMKPYTPTSNDEKRLGIKKAEGGLCVTIRTTNKVPRHDKLCLELARHYALRDIIKRRDVLVKGIVDKAHLTKKLEYCSPKSVLVLDEHLTFDPPYEKITARLQIRRANSKLDTDLQEGILVADDLAIHQVTRFASDLNQDPIGQTFFGRLDCQHIREFQLEFEACREEGKSPPWHNPVDIVDPNRKLGLDTNHPFVEMLFKKSEERLRQLVENARSKEKKVCFTTSKKTQKLIDKLNIAVAAHLRDNNDEDLLLSPRTPEQEAQLQSEGVFLNPHFRKIAVGEVKRMGYTVLSLGEDEDPDSIFITIEGRGISVDTCNPKLRPQKRQPDRLSAYFEIRGEEVSSDISLTVRHKETDLIAPITRILEVVEPEDPYEKCIFGLSFGRQTYTIRDNGTRTIKFIAKGTQFKSVNWPKAKITISNSEAITIGGKLNVERVIDDSGTRDIWVGEIKVCGCGVGNQATISLLVPGNDLISITISVADEKPPKNVSISIEFVPEDFGSNRAIWDKENPNLLKVSAVDPALKRYLGREEANYPGQKSPEFRATLAEIVADKVAQRLVERKFQNDPGAYEDPDRVIFEHNEETYSFLEIAHSIMCPDA